MGARHLTVLPDPAFPLADPRLEGFADALARGLTPSDAAIEAGFARHAVAARVRAARGEVAARAAVLKARYDSGEAATLEQMLDRLLAAAAAATGLKSAAGLNAARGLLADAVRLKREIDAAAAAARVAARPPPRVMSLERWMATLPNKGGDAMARLAAAQATGAQVTGASGR